MSESSWPHGLQHTRLPCASLSPRVYSDSCPSSQWCHPTISCSVISSSCLQSFPASGSFLINQFFAWGGQSTGASVSATVLSMNVQGWFLRTDWLDFLAVQGTLKSLLQHYNSKAQIQCSAFFMGPALTSVHGYWKNHSFDFVGQVVFLLLNTLSRFVTAFFPRGKCLLILWLQSLSAVILETKKITCHCFVFFSICHEGMGPDAMVFVFWMLSFKPAFLLSSFTFTKRIFNYSSLSAIRVLLSAYLKLLIFLLAILIPACASSSLAFLVMYFAYKLNKLGDTLK